MPISNPGRVATKQDLANFYQQILPYLGGGGSSTTATVYGIRIDPDESDPSAKVTYIADAVGMTPAYMNYTTGEFNYGSWENAFFMPRPCMLKNDGTVDYYLDPDDYTKKADGVTASDVANTSYAGNAMMEWGQNGKKIWMKIVPYNKYGADIYIADQKVDDDYHDWSFHNSDGVSADHFYTAIYNGSNSNNVVRSLSNAAVMTNIAGATEYEYAKANNVSGKQVWGIEVIADRLLITFLLVLISKSLDTQTSFGKGLVDNGTEALLSSFRTGVHDDKGLFYGTNNGSAVTYTNAVKVFGMENWWGLVWRRCHGDIMLSDKKTRKRKLTYNTEDGSETVDYNFDGTGYNTIPGATAAISGTSPSGITNMLYTQYGPTPVNTGGSTSTYYCDSSYFNPSASINAVLCIGGRSTNGLNAGPFAFNYEMGGTYNYIFLGSSLSAKPLSH